MANTDDQPDLGWGFKNTSKSQSLEKPAFLQVPAISIVALEHPCIIKNTERGVQTLGGIRHLQKVIAIPNLPESCYSVLNLRQ